MTPEELENILIKYCDKEISRFNRSRLFLYRKSIRILPTKILESWEKDANFKLPEKICFPKDSCLFKLDHKGVHIDGKLTSWPMIKYTALAVHHIDGGRREHYSQNYFMAYTIKGTVMNYQIGDLTKYSNLLGHFIELYKTH